MTEYKAKKNENGSTRFENIALLRKMLLEIKKRHEYITNNINLIKRAMK